MKCRSVACIWPDSPPPHRVTAVAALSQPPTLYTGGSDGSIVWWNLSASDAKQEIKQVAMLCGHTAPIADLGICLPAANSGEGEIENSSNVFMNSNSADYGSLISMCTDGVLCVWSRGSGHCRHRRKMAPWVGTPFALRPLPENPRYVCIACCFIDAVNLIDHQSLDSSGVSGPSMDRHPQYQRPPKCTVVIVDSYTLTIVQTVFHGNLSIGPLRFMAIVSPVDSMEEQSVLLVDSFGKLQHVPILKGLSTDGENGTSLQKDCYNLGMTDSVEVSSKGLQVVMCAASAQVLALIYRTYCIFQLADSGTIIGQISFINNQLCSEGGSTQLHVTGGMFLESDDARKVLKSQECHDMVAKNFAVWNNRGFAVVYKITYSDGIFGFKMLCVIPAVAHLLDVRLSICFVQLNCSLLRIESYCFDVEEPFLWKPRVTIWLLLQQYGNNWDLCQESKMLGEGRFFIDWIESSTSANENEDLRHDDGVELTGWGTQLSQEDCVPCCKVDNLGTTDIKHRSSQKERLVSSSMVISESYYIPYAVVYGFHSGEIEVVCFNIFIDDFTRSRGQCHRVDSKASKQYFLGHTGPVLCLASHWMGGTANGWSFSRFLVSGSMDCTVCVWDLDSGDLLAVMHHHVAPVRQVILPPRQTGHPWNACFLSVGEDSCVALVSLETLRVERMFPGHRYNPTKVVWDGKRNYLACLCQNNSGTCGTLDVLYIWDLKTGACERVLHGTASHSMFDHFCKGISTNSLPGGILNENTSASSLLFPLGEDASLSQSHLRNLGKGTSSSNLSPSIAKMREVNSLQKLATKGNSMKLFSLVQSVLQSDKHPIKCFCPFPGLAALSFDLVSLMSPFKKYEILKDGGEKQGNTHVNEQGVEMSKDASDGQDKIPEKELGAEKPSPHHVITDGTGHVSSDLLGTSTYTPEDDDWVQSLEGCLLQFSLSFLHLWEVDNELDELLITQMKLKKPGNFPVAFGLQGDRGSLTLTFPSPRAKLELWKSSSEFSAIRSLTMVSLAQRTISLSHSFSAASSALAAFYTRNCLERIPDVKPPLLQLLVSFWQDESECVRMAARSLFHCAASRAIPLPLRCQKENNHENFPTFPIGTGVSEHEVLGAEKASRNRLISDKFPETQGFPQAEESEILAWLESFEVQDWISCVGGTSQDAITSHIIVAAALAIWYPSLVKTSLASLVVHRLLKLVVAMNDKYSSTAAELLAEGMECTWKPCIAPEIPRLIGDIFIRIESASGAPVNISAQIQAVSPNIQETLVGILLPNLAMADVLGFLNVIESQIWSTASDSPVHVVALMALVRVIRGSPRNLVQCLDKAVNFILQTMDPSNSVMRKTCLQTSMAALKEVVRIFPMVALNDRSTRLAVGDAIAEMKNASIRVYDMQSMTKMKVLDASGPPGLPTLLGGASEVVVTTGISALSFSPDGEGLVAFSEHGLMIRWWSLGSAWWEKLSRNFVPVQCTKLIFVPPWEGFSPNSTRSSIMACVMGLERRASPKENTGGSSDVDRLKLSIQNLDLSYRLEWVGDRKVLLTRHGQELGTFQL